MAAMGWYHSMRGPAFASMLLVAKFAALESKLGIVEQFLAFRTKLLAVMFAFAVDFNHLCNGLLFSFNSCWHIIYICVLVDVVVQKYHYHSENTASSLYKICSKLFAS